MDTIMRPNFVESTFQLLKIFNFFFQLMNQNESTPSTDIYQHMGSYQNFASNIM